jgi:ABC-type polysaccharide transport system permease subunit
VTFTLRDAIDVTLQLGNTVNTLWTIYLTVIVAIAGALLFSSVRLTTSQKVVATVSFLLFAFINWRILFETYSLLIPAIDEMKAQVPSAELKSTAFEKAISSVSFSSAIWLPSVYHVVLGAAVLFLIWFNPRSPRRSDE